MMNLEEHLRNYILEECLPGEEPDMLADDDDLIETGVLDSLAVMKLVAHLEKTFQIKVPTEEINRENFSSIQQLAKFVGGKLSSHLLASGGYQRKAGQPVNSIS